MKEYQHGGDINSFAKKLGCNSSQVIDLSSNINFIKPNIKSDFNTLNISSYPSYEKLYEIIAKKYSVKASKIELFNGASSAIFTLFKTLNLSECFIYSPSYLEYKKAALLFEYKLHKIDRFKNLKQEIKKDSLVVFVNPSSPDGRYYELDKLMKEWIDKNCTILVDESFLQFTKKESVIKYLKSYDKLYILKSLTKFYSCAGVRIGTIISSKQNIQKLKKLEPMWKLSAFDMQYIIDALDNKSFEKRTLDITKKNREYLIKNLKTYSFIDKVYKSDSNFVLIKLKNLKAKDIQEYLLDRKIMIRDCSNFDFLDENFVRIAVKSKKSINKLLEVFNRI